MISAHEKASGIVTSDPVTIFFVCLLNDCVSTMRLTRYCLSAVFLSTDSPLLTSASRQTFLRAVPCRQSASCSGSFFRCKTLDNILDFSIFLYILIPRVPDTEKIDGYQKEVS